VYFECLLFVKDKNGEVFDIWKVREKGVDLNLTQNVNRKQVSAFDLSAPAIDYFFKYSSDSRTVTFFNFFVQFSKKIWLKTLLNPEIPPGLLHFFVTVQESLLYIFYLFKSSEHFFSTKIFFLRFCKLQIATQQNLEI